ncbi:Zinc carboxypeptidase [Hyunsoonleella jejuensis]|uniref:Zinc carboxypeptidase n=2 Tax=Hyunsoonleella jejuensis TaxID=419940 RepID=A0A1H9G8J6_9FLAO|nr:Zinc carboxypeptidase [Hyunsoonleella jejuensis]
MFTFVHQICYMEITDLQFLFEKHKEESLYHRYITNENITPLLTTFKSFAKVEIVGKSVLGDDIFSITIGHGPKKILMWSQMHGNESTTTKAIFDLLNTCVSNEPITNGILKACTLCIIPILNPDGAKAYTRVNANRVDLNRDAQNRSQPESNVLRKVFEDFKPNFCYNLHGQRTIFSAGTTNNSATVSFLAPAQDASCTITPTRKIAMEIIAEMNGYLQEVIPNQVGVYDDAFNINCVGDTFQSENVPTILFEAGHFINDYAREKTRELIYISYLTSLAYIADNAINGNGYKAYFDIPENKKLFYDVIIKNVRLNNEDEETFDLAFQYEERLEKERIVFIPILKKIGSLEESFGHKQINANAAVVSSVDGTALKIDSENVFVKLNNEEIALFSK